MANNLLTALLDYVTDSTRIDNPKTKKDESNYWDVDRKEIHSLMDKIIYHETGGTNLTTEVQKVNVYGQDDLSTPNIDESQNVIGTKPGYGMGLFQYEKHYDDPKTSGYDQRGAQTGITRLQNIAKAQGISLPSILDNTLNSSGKFNKEYQRLVDSGFNLALLNEDIQKSIFIADKFEHPSAKSNLGIAAGVDDPFTLDIDEGRQFSDDEIADYWADYHQAGWQLLPTQTEQTLYRNEKIDSFEKSLLSYIQPIAP